MHVYFNKICNYMTIWPFLLSPKSVETCDNLRVALEPLTKPKRHSGGQRPVCARMWQKSGDIHNSKECGQESALSTENTRKRTHLRAV